MTETEFKTIIMPLHKKLYACAFAILRNESDAADCLQDSFTRLWENRERLPLMDNIPGYAAVTVRNMALNMVSRRPKTAEPIDKDLLDLPDSSLSPAASVEQKDSMKAIGDMLGQLSPGQRRVMELSSLAGLSNSEISEATGLSDENVRVIISRARRKLKSLFSKRNSLLN
ncbi:MAG: sigma-70 family RNA polymerase sigma factor [Muribaculaceae bacterium]|nr:sigma-70 family RNA polymerase sigma factor [Muribaculaceae bacterium]